MTDRHERHKELIAGLRASMYDWTEVGVRAALDSSFAPEAEVHLAHPFEELGGGEGWYESALAPLAVAMPDVERRDTIVMAGDDWYGNDWVGCGGYYTGTWIDPFLDIPATGHQAAMRYHEYFRIVEGRIVEMQALWDIPELMMQADAWPMPPSLGREWQVPAPATQDGIVRAARDADRSSQSVDHVVQMLGDMGKHPTEPVEAMRLEHWWHPKFSWYGPSGIGTGRGVDGFRRHHQIPFLNAMPDRSGGYKGDAHFFGDNDYVGVTAWPGMRMTMSGDGFLGIAAANQEITMRSLDFWRIEDGLIRENWVLVDLLHVWSQLGVDVLARMRELTSRPGGPS